MNIDEATAHRILAACHEASEHIANIIRPRPAGMTEADFLDLRHRCAEVAAYMADFLILPTIEAYPHLNPYR